MIGRRLHIITEDTLVQYRTALDAVSGINVSMARLDGIPVDVWRRSNHAFYDEAFERVLADRIPWYIKGGVMVNVGGEAQGKRIVGVELYAVDDPKNYQPQITDR